VLGGSRTHASLATYLFLVHSKARYTVDYPVTSQCTRKIDVPQLTSNIGPLQGSNGRYNGQKNRIAVTDLENRDRSLRAKNIDIVRVSV
jgi:hypothetical protein